MIVWSKRAQRDVNRFAALNAAYLVDYRIEGDVIRILRVRHGREAR